MGRYDEKIPMLRIDPETKMRLLRVAAVQGEDLSKVRRELIEISLIVFEYFERRGITDLTEISRLIEREMSARQLKLFDDNNGKLRY